MGPKGFLGHMQNRWMLQLVVNGDENFDVESSGLEKCSTNSGLSTVLRWMVHRVHLNLSDFGGSFSAGYLLDQNLGISSYVHSACHMKIGEYKIIQFFFFHLKSNHVRV
jgi:hypothetical protein